MPSSSAAAATAESSSSSSAEDVLAIKALVTAVENTGSSNGSNSSSSNSSTANNKNANTYETQNTNFITKGTTNADTDTDAYNCQPLLHLFQHQPIKVLLEAVQNGSTDKRNRNQLKRYFAGMNVLLERIVNEEAFVPASIQDDDDEHEEGEEEKDHDQADNTHGKEVQPDPRSDDCLRVLKYAALTVQAFLNGRLLRKKTKDKEKQQQQQLLQKQQQQQPRPTVLKVPPDVVEVAQTLHDILFTLHSCGKPAGATKAVILSLCESWWLSGTEHKESLIVQCLPLLVLKTCEGDETSHSNSNSKFITTTTKATILRLYKLRYAFGCIDFADPSSDSLRQLLLRVASNPLCLKVPEGKKFLATLLQQDVHLVQDLHLAFRAQIPEAKATILSAYGDIYHRAWKEVREKQQQDDDASNKLNDNEEEEEEEEETTTIRNAIEHQVLQDLMHSVIHVANPATFQSILAVLDPLHADKKNKEVANLLFRLYSPILWRSLSATNPIVRKNAVIILEKVFPLHDPLLKQSAASMKDAVFKATEAMRVALQDPDPSVRVAASGATARNCAMFWDALPPTEIRSLLNHIVIEHASDSSSALVRAAALNAAAILLDAKQSHGVLRALLPSLGNLIHDKSEKVRVAAVRMLIKVKKVPGIRFYHVVPVNHLSARLVQEAKLHRSPRNAVTKELTALLLSSYFPQGNDASAKKQLKRTLTFLLTDPSAASVFYANLADYLEVESVVKFILMLFTCLKTSVEADQANQVKDTQAQKKRRRRSSETSSSSTAQTKDHDDPDRSRTLSAANTPVMAGIADTINTLWESIAVTILKPKNLACKKVLEDRFSDKDCLIDIMAHFERKGLEYLGGQNGDESRRNECFRICSSLLNCAAKLDEASNKKVVSYVIPSLSSVSKEESECTIPLVTSYLAFLCSSKFVDNVANSIARSIEFNPVEDVSLFSPDFEQTLGFRRSRRSSIPTGSKGDNIPILPNTIAWGVLEHILQGASSEGQAIRQTILSSKSATRHLEKALEKGIKLAEKLLADSFGQNFGNDEVEYVIRASEAYGRFALHKESSEALEHDDKTYLDRQVGKLLLWTTNKIMPASLSSEEDNDGVSTLRDCDLSHISRLSESLVHVDPASLSIASPPHQKANRGSTPEAMRGHSSLFVQSPSDSPMMIKVKVANSLLLSSCMISSEMLAMGLSDADEISKAALGWCAVFDQPLKSAEKELMTAFVRLGFQLYRSSRDINLLEHVLVKCNLRLGEHDFEDEITNILKSVLRTQSGTTDLVSIFMNVSRRIIQIGNSNDTVSFESASSASELWSEGETIEVVLDVILGNSAAALAFARTIVRKLVDNKTDTTCSPDINFHAKCLTLIMKRCGGPDLTAILCDLDVQNYQEDGEMRSLVENLLECNT